MISDATADCLWRQVEPQVFITRGQFFDELAGWELNEVTVDGKVAFVTAQRPAVSLSFDGHRRENQPEDDQGVS